MAVKRRNKSVYISVYSYIIPAFWLKNPVFPGVYVSTIDTNDIEEIVKRLEKSFPRASCRQQGSAILKVNIEDYIDSIMVHPFAEDWYVDRVRKLCELKEIEGKFMGKSNLYQCPDFSDRKNI